MTQKNVRQYLQKNMQMMWLREWGKLKKTLTYTYNISTGNYRNSLIKMLMKDFVTVIRKSIFNIYTDFGNCILNKKYRHFIALRIALTLTEILLINNQRKIDIYPMLSMIQMISNTSDTYKIKLAKVSNSLVVTTEM